MSEQGDYVAVTDDNHTTAISADLDGRSVVVEADDGRVSVPKGFGVAFHENREEGVVDNEPDISVDSEGAFPDVTLAHSSLALGMLALFAGGWLSGQFSNGTAIIAGLAGAVLVILGARESFARFSPKFSGDD